MKNLILFVFILTTHFAYSKNDGFKEALEAYRQAFIKFDTAALRATLADDYIHINSGGELLGKKVWLTRLKLRMQAVKENDFKYIAYTYEDLELKEYGPVVVATFKIVFTGSEKGETFKNVLRTTQVWQKNNKRWIRKNLHETLIKE